MSRCLAPAAALALLIASGVIHGRWTGRWSLSKELEGRVAALDRVPMAAGDWSGRDQPVDPRMMEAAGIAGHLVRRYENPRGEAVTVLLVCGRPGPISVHTPEVCYGGVGYEPSAPRSRRSLPTGRAAEPAEFWSADLAKSGPALADHLRIFYSWNAAGVWKAAENPRLDFAAAGALYKLYVIRQTVGRGDPSGADPRGEFLREFLPVLRTSLFPGG